MLKNVRCKFLPVSKRLLSCPKSPIEVDLATEKNVHLCCNFTFLRFVLY